MMNKQLKSRKRRNWSTIDIVFSAILGLLGLSIVYVFYTTFLQSIVPHTEYIRNPLMIIPSKLDFSPYKYVLTESMIPRGFINSIIITVSHIGIRMVFTTMVAYVLTKNFPGEKLFYVFVFLPGIIPAGVLANYIVIDNLNLTNNILSLIIPGCFSWSAAIVMARFFCNVPYELEEAAVLDGASEWTIIWKVIIPLSLPIIATQALYGAVDTWNAWYNGMLYMRNASKMPLQTILRNIIQDSNNVTLTDAEAEARTIYTESIKMACLMVSMIPIMCVYPFIQKHFVPGLKSGAVKG